MKYSAGAGESARVQIHCTTAKEAWNPSLRSGNQKDSWAFLASGTIQIAEFQAHTYMSTRKHTQRKYNTNNEEGPSQFFNIQHQEWTLIYQFWMIKSIRG